LIKKINVDGIRLSAIEMFKESKDVDAIEMITFLLSKGLYTGKKVKEWQPEKVTDFIEMCKTAAIKAAENKVEPLIDEDIDLYKKYAQFLGDNKLTETGLRAEVKNLLNVGNLQDAGELAVFMLINGLCVGMEGGGYTPAHIEEWIDGIKADIVNNPLEIDKAEGGITSLSEKTNTSLTDEEDKKYEISMSEFFIDIKSRILDHDAAEDDIKKYILDTIKDKKVENLEKFHGGVEGKDPIAETEKMYHGYFEGVVKNTLAEHDAKMLDMKVEITKMIAKAKELGKQVLGSVVQEAKALYTKRGEVPGIREVSDQVHEICKEVDIEYYNKVMAHLAEGKKTPVVNTDTKNIIPFDKRYPEIYEKVKDCKTLDDLFKQAKDLEAIQDFMVVSAMITYMISSGNMTKDNEPVKWDQAQIEMWINNMFQNAETVAEAEANKIIDAPKTDPTLPATDAPGAIPGAGTETVDTVDTTRKVSEAAKTETDEKAQPGSTIEANGKPGEEKPAVEQGADGQKPVAGTTNNEEFPYPKDYTWLTETLPYKKLYATKNNDMWDGVKEIAIKLIDEGKKRMEIVHLIGDTFKKIANDDHKSLLRCQARNFKRTHLADLYKMIEEKGYKLEIPRWEIA
jgi:hypothetical protein